MVRAGVHPGLLDEIIWWQSDDFWVWALDALAVCTRGSRPTARAWASARSATVWPVATASISAHRAERITTRRCAPNIAPTRSRAGDRRASSAIRRRSAETA